MGWQWQECAKSGHSQTVRRTGQIDPDRPFEISHVKGREVQESDPRLRAWIVQLAAGGFRGRGGPRRSPTSASAAPVRSPPQGSGQIQGGPDHGVI
jgi:hypothetical protein